MHRESCLVVGLGNIGMGFDFKLGHQNVLLSHCSAINEHQDFFLSGAVDPNTKLRTDFESKYKSPAFSNIDDALKSLNPTIGIICNPTEHHHSTLSTLLQSPDLKAILCEKPLSYDFNEAQEMVNICADKGVALYVNYMRRSDPNVIEIKRRIDCGEISQPIKVNAWYSKGILNNGSHLINLISYWLGEYIGHNVFNHERHWQEMDPQPDVFVEFDKGDLVLMSAWEEFYTHFTVELLSPSGRLYYSNGGEKIVLNHVEKDSLFEGYKVLSKEPEIFENFFSKYQYHVYEELLNAIHMRPSYLSNGVDALRTLEILRNICEDT